MKKLVFTIICLILINTAYADFMDEASSIQGNIIDFISGDETIIVEGKYASNSEKAIIWFLQENFAQISQIPSISEAEFNQEEFSGTVILLGGPNQNQITKEVLNDLSYTKEEDKLSFGIVTYLTGERKYLIFSDFAGYDNLPRTSAQKSPLANFMPVEYVPAAATVASVSLLWLWNLLSKIFGKVFRKILAAKILKYFKKKSIKEHFKGFHMWGIRIKFREWLSILTAAIIFAVAISYTYVQNNLLNLLLSIVIVNGIIYTIRHLTRLVMDKRHDLHTEYHVWIFGALLTIFSGWLGNTFSLAGYTLSDEKNTKKEGKIKYFINLITFLMALIFFVWNFLTPAVILQMCVILSITISFLQMFPITPFAGKTVIKWNKFIWLITFIPMALVYIAVNLMM
jgi:hypothetical protein